MANLFFQLVSNRCERASVIVTSNKPFGRRVDVVGDVTVPAMIDRLGHHAEVIALEGDTHRLKDCDLTHLPDNDAASPTTATRASTFNRRPRVTFQALTTHQTRARGRPVPYRGVLVTSQVHPTSPGSVPWPPDPL